MADFINEVEEELRKDEYNKLLRRYGPYLLAATIVIVVLAGVFEWQKAQADRMARATSASFVEATNTAADGDLDSALEQFLTLADEAPDGYAGLSLLRGAELELERGNLENAVSLFDRAAQTFDLPRHAQLASLKAGYVLADLGRYDDVSARMGPLSQKDAPYEFLARELSALAALKKDDIAEARRQYGYLNSVPGVPGPLQARAEQALAVMPRAETVTPETVTPEEAPAVTPDAPSEDETNDAVVAPNEDAADESSEEGATDEN